MSGFLGFLIIVFVCIPLLWRWLSPIFSRFAQNRMEDFIRHQMGMPSRKEEKKARKRAQREQEAYSNAHNRSRNTYGYNNNSYSRNEPIIPKEYAEDVEFVEIKEFSQTEIPDPPEKKSKWSTFRASHTSIKVERQVEDADFTDI